MLQQACLSARAVMRAHLEIRLSSDLRPKHSASHHSNKPKHLLNSNRDYWIILVAWSHQKLPEELSRSCRTRNGDVHADVCRRNAAQRLFKHEQFSDINSVKENTPFLTPRGSKDGWWSCCVDALLSCQRCIATAWRRQHRLLSHPDSMRVAIP